MLLFAIALVLYALVVVYFYVQNRQLLVLDISPRVVNIGSNDLIVIRGRNFADDFTLWLNDLEVQNIYRTGRNQISFYLPDEFNSPQDINVSIENLRDEGATACCNRSNITTITLQLPPVIYSSPYQLDNIEERRAFMMDYLGRLTNEDYIVFIVASDETSRLFDELLEQKFRSIGLSESLIGQWRHSYAAIIDGGYVIFEKLGSSNYCVVENSIVLDDLAVSLISAGLDAMMLGSSPSRITINNIDHALGHRGLNIVIFDKRLGHVIDSVSFDAHYDLTFRRKVLQ